MRFYGGTTDPKLLNKTSKIPSSSDYGFRSRDPMICCQLAIKCPLMISQSDLLFKLIFHNRMIKLKAQLAKNQFTIKTFTCGKGLDMQVKKECSKTGEPLVEQASSRYLWEERHVVTRWFTCLALLEWAVCVLQLQLLKWFTQKASHYDHYYPNLPITISASTEQSI